MSRRKTIWSVKHLSQDLNPSPPASQSEPEEAAGNETGATRSASLYRIFGSKPGTYGAGILPVIEERNWETVNDLAEVYAAWGGYAYTQQEHGVNARQEFRRRFSQIVVAAKNQDNREHDIFDSDDYMQYHGGMIATVRALTGRNPRQFFGDSADPSRSQGQRPGRRSPPGLSDPGGQPQVGRIHEASRVQGRF